MKHLLVALSLVAVLAVSACAQGHAVNGSNADKAFNSSVHK